MAIVKTGTFTVTTGGVAQNLNLGFVPSYIKMQNLTNYATAANGELLQAEWYSTMANATGLGLNYAAAATTSVVVTNMAANGFTPFQTTDANLFTVTRMTITGISQAAQAVVLTASTYPVVIGDVVTFSGVVGMTQINTLRGKIVAINAGVSITVDINTTGFTAYTSGGQANVITTNTVNNGQIGLTLGTTLMVTTADVWNYVAMLDTPVTS